MELLCVMAALAALFLGSAAFTLKARIPAGLAPLVTLSCIVAVLTLAGMAGVLLPRRLGCVRPVCGRRRVGAAAAERG